MTNEISTQVSKQVPKSIVLKNNAWYSLTDGSNVQVVNIRTNGQDTVVYYRKKSYRSKWYKPSYDFSNATIQQFKSQLLELGSVDNIRLNPLS